MPHTDLGSVEKLAELAEGKIQIEGSPGDLRELTGKQFHLSASC